jgi:UDP-N-acetylmuramate dehydrogenase
MVEPDRETALAPLTTLSTGGHAEYFVEAETLDDIVDALRWADERRHPVTVLGGGSNVVVADGGVSGLVLRVANRGLTIEDRGGSTVLEAFAGECWDEAVAAAVIGNLAGIECLSGIPGTVGATPIQNVGAYGQEVARVIETVRVLHRETLEVRDLTARECGFGYRTSRLRRPGNPYIVVAVRFLLRRGGPPTLSYPQVARRLTGSSLPSLGEVRSTVLDLRRSKSMVLDDDDGNRRSVGSFFVNPVVDGETVAGMIEKARRLGVLPSGQRPPSHELGGGRFKLSAAWLIERAGYPRGAVCGRVGLSTNHALAVINRGEATSSEIVDFAREIRRAVHSRLGIDLTPEPAFLGFSTSDPTQ